MGEKNESGRVIDAGQAETEQHEPDSEIAEVYRSDINGHGAHSGGEKLRRSMDEHRGYDLAPTGGDPDGVVEDSAFVGDTAPGGGNPTPDQDVVDEIGEAVGLTYEDNEELRTTEKIEDRDKHRWELDPMSSEDYKDRVKEYSCRLIGGGGYLSRQMPPHTTKPLPQRIGPTRAGVSPLS